MVPTKLPKFTAVEADHTEKRLGEGRILKNSHQKLTHQLVENGEQALRCDDTIGMIRNILWSHIRGSTKFVCNTQSP